jgi:cell division protein FtsN
MLPTSLRSGARSMSTSQRVSRGFHWLGLLLAVIALLVGGTFSVIYALNEAGPALSSNPTPQSSAATPSSGKNLTIDGVDISPTPDSPTPDQQNGKVDQMVLPYWRIKFAAKGLAISLAASLAVYGIVRAIGWAIGGFAAAR